MVEYSVLVTVGPATVDTCVSVITCVWMTTGPATVEYWTWVEVMVGPEIETIWVLTTVGPAMVAMAVVVSISVTVDVVGGMALWTEEKR